ncbi:MAG TPA: PAC2 family protein [Nitrososphaeraceae archaeon]|nr:PAC2 family protein [Nitrososphaeraceae archaeon]
MARQISRITGKTIATAHRDIDNDRIFESKTRVKPLSKVIQRNKKLDAPILIAGFPGPGLVGSISTSYIIDKLDMYQIACVESEHIAPGVIYVGGKLRHPFRLYSNNEGNVCVLVCEAPIMIQGMYSVLNTVMKWGLDNRVKEVMVLDGIAVEGLPDSKRTPMILSSDGKSADAANLLHDDGSINVVNKNRQEGADSGPFYANTAFIGGIAGGLLSACLSNGIACKALLVLASSGIPDPEGAAILLESVAKTTNDQTLKIDTQQLREQGANVKRRMEEIMRSIREQQAQQYQQQQQQQQQAQAETHVRQGIMYG